MDDDARFVAIYDTYIRQIYAYCLRRLPAEDAQDASADIFTVVWRRWDERPLDDEVLPWIYGIARNTVANRNRSLRRQKRPAGKLIGIRPAIHPEIESADGGIVERDQVRRAMARLSEDDRETIRLVEWEGLDRHQVAAIMGVSRSAIDQRLSRAYRGLERLLDDDRPPSRVGRPAGGSSR